MILGIGADICHIERIRRSLSRFGDAWIEHLFSADEKRLCHMTADPGMFFARGFCGKEACAKALGIGISDGIDWCDIKILQSSTHVALELSGVAKQRLMELTPKNHKATLLITCSGDRHLAHALVIASAIPVISMTNSPA